MSQEEIFHMELDASKIDEDYSGAPKTPRGDDGLIEGDRKPEMPLPEQQFFVVMPMHKPSPKESVLRPVPGFKWTIFPNRETAKEVAESQCRANPDTAFGVYGPYADSTIISSKPWDHSRSTPCDQYEMLSVVVRREYYPPNHPEAYYKHGPLKGQAKPKAELRQYVCNHVDFGFCVPSKNVVEDVTALKIYGSALTSYLDKEGNLISPNVALLAKPPSEHLKDEDYQAFYKTIIKNQHTAVDALIDEEFRKALPKLHSNNVSLDYVAPFHIFDNQQNVLFSGEQPVPSGRLPFAFAQILRTALTSWYGKVSRITMLHTPLAIRMEFNMGQE